jgi:hypothetical protein
MKNTNKSKKREGWFYNIFINPWGLPLMIPFIILIITNSYFAFLLIFIWGVYFLWCVKKSDPMFDIKSEDLRTKK